ncbi:uroporphyrinogen-III C-methyltransferase [Clostridium beijerinckii]|uniref:uroporphyrinogen-III C-methyltransferase n=1 Tax=Clostridium beijerinckii TaxID=1520 RepID=UPI00098C7A58|nr:uroporphyrinogen-III C-methyltransferase [Clostridium beijerinckii]MBA8936915.1 uroporphyrinogen III methyltransferase/synthase [Clostridium beijerinckii]NRU40620.1 uroporphyrinogen III methyltransferase/synthase [Clostridium beijerinckii]NSA96105.1 uroporphyrinogen III methyltransferase/synthase [Clostridium beijerinckii]OOM60518.1 uroporphyrinogen-III C-methyltransferase [Clostridium beijerinckii]OOM69903.1 uroporphyrinogen-III C-methyltransferase [Clostridium beijerinckii]
MSKVYIIGTGPGDEELLTLKAVKVLKRCTAVLYDRLVSNNVLNYLEPNCEIYYCGKEPGAHSKTQEEINELLVKLAKEGHTVGRIKGGDPYVFGRGGEEVLALVDENIEFEVIPGVTSPIAVLNYAGIPITHRKIAQSFHVITGKSAQDLNVNFKALAKEEGTLVFMMGLSNLDNIVEELINNGKEPTFPCAVVMRGTSAKQKKVVGTLENISQKVKDAKLQSPCIIVVGEVVNLNKDLNWYENKPLFGKNICITRSRRQSEKLKNKLVDLGAEVTSFNSIKIESSAENLNDYIDKIENYDHIVFTSVNSVEIFFDYLIEKDYDIRRIKAKISAIGAATANSLKQRGIICFAKAREFVGEGLVSILKPHLKADQTLLLPCSAKSRKYIYEELTNCGASVDKVYIYDTVCGSVVNKRSFDEVDIVFFTSPSTVENMIDMLGIEEIKKKQVIAIGPKTNEPLEKYGIKAYVCKEHSEEGFLKEIENLCKK